MTIQRFGRGLLGATLLGVAPFSSVFAAPVDDPERITITAKDIEASNTEAAAAVSALISMWTAEFKRLGLPFAAPRVARYRGNTRTACGVMPASNAVYCYNNN